MSIHSSIQETSSNPLELIHSNSSDSSNPRKSLTELFQHIFSTDQLDACQKHGLLSKKELQEAHKMAKRLIRQQQLPTTSKEWKKLTEWVIMLRDRYSDKLEKQSIRTYKSDRERIERLDQIQKLSEHLEVYGQAQEDLTDLLPALKKLRNDWKNRSKDVESIIKSILSTITPDCARVVTINRALLIKLGLGIKSLGKSYLVFEEGATQESERQEMINKIARDFSIVFEENASQNLTRMASSYRKVFQQDTDNVINEIQQLAQEMYIGGADSFPIPSAPVLEGVRATTTTEVDTNTESPIVPQHQSGPEQEETDPVPVETQQSAASTSDSDNEGADPFPFNVAKPVFEPASRDWPYILKYKLPAHTVSYWCYRMPFQHKQNIVHNNNNRVEGIWTTSISRLSKHFTKTGYAYYSTMLNNAKLMHVHQTELFDFASKSLIKCYAAIQLEQGCSNLGRALVYLYRLEQDQNST